MILALGRHLLFREIGRGGWVPVVAIVAIVLLIRFWPAVVERVGRWWGSR